MSHAYLTKRAQLAVNAQRGNMQQQLPVVTQETMEVDSGVFVATRCNQQDPYGVYLLPDYLAHSDLF